MRQRTRFVLDIARGSGQHRVRTRIDVTGDGCHRLDIFPGGGSRSDTELERPAGRVYSTVTVVSETAVESSTSSSLFGSVPSSVTEKVYVPGSQPSSGM